MPRDSSRGFSFERVDLPTLPFVARIGGMHELAIIGAGNMAEAIARGVLRAKLLSESEIIASDVSEARRGLFQNELGIRAVTENAAAVREARTILLSVKPQQMQAVLGEIGRHADAEALIVSIAAGVSSASIEQHLGQGRGWRVVRTMPNTPMLVGEGMVAISAGRHATGEDLARARRLFEAAATVIELPEDRLDAVTAISGSGPAYFFFLVEQMVRAGVELGLTREQAHTLATRTALGAAKMLVTSLDSPEELRRKVTSPNGTTQAAIETMQSRGVPEGIVAGVLRAAARSRELGS
jgi:pyrroline-5-carboxylate reductase